jgi:hypothetical protein
LAYAYQFVGDAHLPESRLFDGERHDGGFDLSATRS